MKMQEIKSNIYLSAILIMLGCYFAGVNLVFFCFMIVIVPAICAYALCTSPVRNFIYASISAFVFCLVCNVVRGNESLLRTICGYLLLLIPGVILGVALKTKRAFTDIFVVHTAYDFMLMLVAFAVIRFAYNIDITLFLRDILADSFTEQFSIIKSLYSQVAPTLADMEHQLFEALYIGLPGYIPFAAMCIFAFLFLLRYAICKMLCTRYFITISNFSNGFDTFHVGIITNCVALVLLFLSYMSETPVFTMICLNALFIVMLLYFVNGISLLEHQFKQKIHYPGRRFLAILAMFILLIIVSALLPVINFIYVFLFFGFTDSLFDFRKLNSKKGDF